MAPTTPLVHREPHAEPLALDARPRRSDRGSSLYGGEGERGFDRQPQALVLLPHVLVVERRQRQTHRLYQEGPHSRPRKQRLAGVVVGGKWLHARIEYLLAGNGDVSETVDVHGANASDG